MRFQIIALFLSGIVMVIGLGFFFPFHLSAQEVPETTVEIVRQVIYADLLSEGNASQATVGANVVVSGDYAMGSWGLGETGGVTIVEQRGNQRYVLCSTGGVYSASEMQQFCNVPTNAAQQLEQQWQQVDN